MKHLFLGLKIIWVLLLAGLSNQTFAQQQRLFESGAFCSVVMVGPKAISLPQHCLVPDARYIHLEDLGSLEIERVESLTSYNLSPLDTILVVHLKEKIMVGDASQFSEPYIGEASGQRDGSRPCRIIKIEQGKSLFYHSCFSNKGESGRIIYQAGNPVGIHLGRYAGIPIAAVGNGSDLDFSSGFDALQYEPQKFRIKVSCCKKAEKLVRKIGDGISDIGDGIAKSLEHFKTEIKRVSEEIEKLPRVLSTEYLQSKVSAIKMPEVKLEISLGGLEKELTFKDLLIVGATGGIGLAVLAAYNFDEDRLGRDIERELENGWEWFRDRLTAKPPKKCESVHRDDMEECAVQLKKEIQSYKDKMRAKRGTLKNHIDSRIRKLEE
jgi:hypothetical protein